MKEGLQEATEYWKQSAQTDFEVANNLFRSKYYPYCLFFCQLAVEKLLKGLILERTSAPAPYIHDLRRLSELAGIHCSDAILELLDEMSYFNLAGRYPEEKTKLSRKFNSRALAEKYLAHTRDTVIWLQKEYQKK